MTMWNFETKKLLVFIISPCGELVVSKCERSTLSIVLIDNLFIICINVESKLELLLGTVA